MALSEMAGPRRALWRKARSAVVALAIAGVMSPAAARADEPVALPPPSAPPPVYVQAPPPQAEWAPAPLLLREASVSGPRMITDYEEGDPIPPGYRPAQRTRKGLIVGGAVLFGATYFISVLVAAAAHDAAQSSNSSSAADALYVPAIGPFIEIGQTSSAVASVFLALDGVAQSAGVAMFIAGLVSPRTVLLRETADGGTHGTVRVVPFVARGSSGLGVLGTF